MDHSKSLLFHVSIVERDLVTITKVYALHCRSYYGKAGITSMDLSIRYYCLSPSWFYTSGTRFIWRLNTLLFRKRHLISTQPKGDRLNVWFSLILGSNSRRWREERNLNLRLRQRFLRFCYKMIENWHRKDVTPSKNYLIDRELPNLIQSKHVSYPPLKLTLRNRDHLHSWCAIQSAELQEKQSATSEVHENVSIISKGEQNLLLLSSIQNVERLFCLR